MHNRLPLTRLRRQSQPRGKPWPARARPPSRCGASAVEFAFVAPVFFLMVLGMIELARGIMVRHALTNAARQGCRVGILPGKGNTDITTAANSTLTPLGIKGDTITVQVNDGTK